MMSEFSHRPPRPAAAVTPDLISRRLLECRRDFLRYFRRRLGRAEDAEDAFQDFCLKAVRSADKLEDDEKIDAWLGRILRSILIDHYRRRATRQRGEAAYGRELQVTMRESEADQGEKVCPCVRGVLGRLKPAYAEILSRVDLDGEPRERVAAELALTTTNVGVRLHRARRALKKKIAEVCPTCGEGGFEYCDCQAFSAVAGSLSSGPAPRWIA